MDRQEFLKKYQVLSGWAEILSKAGIEQDSPEGQAIIFKSYEFMGEILEVAPQEAKHLWESGASHFQKFAMLRSLCKKLGRQSTLSGN